MMLRLRDVLLGLAWSVAGFGCIWPTTDGGVYETCQDVKDATGTRTNGMQTLYLNGDSSQPWAAYCHDMNLDAPLEYLTVEAERNYSQYGNGNGVAETQFRRLRLDPDRMQIDLTDTTFATTSIDDVAGAPTVANLPLDGAIPAGWVEYESTVADGGPAATSMVDLSGTAFVFNEDILEGDLSAFFCTITITDGQAASTPPESGEVTVEPDLSSLTLQAISSSANVARRVLADCENMSKESMSVDGAGLPVSYSAQ